MYIKNLMAIIKSDQKEKTGGKCKEETRWKGEKQNKIFGRNEEERRTDRRRHRWKW